MKKEFRIRWEITKMDYMKRRNNVFALIAFSFLFFLSIFFLIGDIPGDVLAIYASRIFSGVLVFFILVYLIQYYFFSKLKYGKGIVMEVYKVDEKGISINFLAKNRKDFYPWSDLRNYYSFRKALPSMSPIFKFLAGLKLFIGNDFIIIDKNRKNFSLKVNDNIESKLESKLSEYLQFKQLIK